MVKEVTSLIIDGDILVYEAGSKADGKFYFYPEDEFCTPVKKEMDVWCKLNDQDPALIETHYKPETFNMAKTYLRVRINNLFNFFLHLKTNYKIFLTGKGNFRETLATIKPYKGNRKDVHRPHHLPALRKYMVKEYFAEVIDGEEADDACGYSQTKSSCICSIDKDLNMIPGFHFNWTNNELYKVSEVEALRNFYCQLITGDATDNILGLFGLGAGCALIKQVNLCTDENAMKALVYHAYQQRFGNYANQFITEIGNLLWIRRKPNQTWSL